MAKSIDSKIANVVLISVAVIGFIIVAKAMDKATKKPVPLNTTK